MKRNKKAALELSMNFIVALILGIAIFGMGLAFAFSILKSSQQVLKEGLPDNFKLEEEACIDRQDKVCIPEIRKEIRARDTDFFGVVINNIDTQKRSFKINVQFSRGVLGNGDFSAQQDPSKWTSPVFRVVELERGDHESIGIPIKPPGGTKRGTYVFNINICFDGTTGRDATKCPESTYGSLYSPTQQITIIVP